MVQKQNIQWFSAKVNGMEFSFKCYTTDTRSGFCHTVVSCDYPTSDTKVSYLNRTWERFTYETALKRAISKFPRDMQDALTAQIIEGKAAEEEERAEAMFARFERLYNGLTPENKEKMKSYPEIRTEDDARACMAMMGLLTLIQG